MVKPLAWFIKKRMEKVQTNRNRNEKDVTTNTTEIQRLIKDNYKELFAKSMDNLKEMDKFLERYHLTRLSQEEIEIMNRLITSSEIESVT